MRNAAPGSGRLLGLFEPEHAGRTPIQAPSKRCLATRDHIDPVAARRSDP